MTAAVYIPCPSGCGSLVLTGRTAEGQAITLDTSVPCYCIVWREGTPEPKLSPSRGYPVHCCPPQQGA
jgi:hypothetical protein